ncbi:MAG: TIGR04211 family SH3 domain-containing protein [Gammaproteobacteria bacterium]
MNRRTEFLAACGMALLIFSAPALAQSAYVTDQLRLGVHQASDTSDRPFTSISSGDRVTILEETQYYARVTIPDGREGWVKKNYLLEDKPAVILLAELEKQRDDAISQLETLKSSLSDREARVSEIEKGVIAREEQAKAEQEELLTLREERVDLQSKLDAYSFAVPGNLFFAAAAASLVFGGLIAWWWFDLRSRSRHGGFRIY